MRDQQGIALIVTLLAMLLLSAIGAALVLVTSADTLIASNSGASSEAFYAADAAFERTVAELRSVPTITSVLTGAAVSAFRDGAAAGPRQLPDGSSTSLDVVVNEANCGRASPCTDPEMDRITTDRPWGTRNPRWRLFSWGNFDEAAGGTTGGLPPFVVSMVADDPAEVDDDPWSDGGSAGPMSSPGAGMVLVRAEAFGRRGARRVVEGSVSRLDLSAWARWQLADPATRGPAPSSFPLLQVTAWREVR
jgi:hypothetical protein